MLIRRSVFHFAFASALAAAAPVVAQAQSLPDGKALVARHIAAVGGRAEMDRHTSLHITGTFGLAALGIEGPFNLYRAKPNRMLQQITLGAFGEAVSGFDGTTAWAVQPGQGAMVLSGPMAEQARLNADFFADFPDTTRYSTIETVAKETFEGRQCYKVRLVRASGGSESIQWFDAETGLAAGAVRSQESPMGKIDVTIVLSDYKDQGGLRMPGKMIQRTPQGDLTITMSTWEWDKVEPSVFSLPEAVKALVKP